MSVWGTVYELKRDRAMGTDRDSLLREINNLRGVLERNGFRRCDIAACNCGSWHHVGGFKARFDEIKEVVEEAGYSTNGRTLLNAVKAMAEDAAEKK